jgi:uncharacterized membrane protein
MNTKVLTHTKVLVASAVAVAIAAPALLRSQGPTAAPTFKAEKCYGIARAGKNDCASTGNNSCAGTSKLSGDAKAWLYVAEGYCERIVDGSKIPK